MKNHRNHSFRILILLAASLILSSCVSKKKYVQATSDKEAALAVAARAGQELDLCLRDAEQLEQTFRTENQKLQNQLLVSETNLQNERNRSQGLEQQLEYFKNTNDNLLDRLSELSVINKTGAESIKKSLEALNDQNRYIQSLTTSMQRKDSINLVLVMNIKRALSDINDEDVTVEVKKGVVYISLSDKLLFRSGSAEISPQAESVLAKIAAVVNDHKELDILVEGHTDNVPIATATISDNWDLSTKRANAIVRTLQNKYGVNPARMTAGGRSQYVPKAPNTTSEGRALNRRTEIIILPKLDQFFELLTPPQE